MDKTFLCLAPIIKAHSGKWPEIHKLIQLLKKSQNFQVSITPGLSNGKKYLQQYF